MYMNLARSQLSYTILCKFLQYCKILYNLNVKILFGKSLQVSSKAALIYLQVLSSVIVDYIRFSIVVFPDLIHDEIE